MLAKAGPSDEPMATLAIHLVVEAELYRRGGILH